MTDLVQRLLTAVAEDRQDAGIAFSGSYQPVGGQGGKIMPPTYPVPDHEVRAAQREGRLPRPYLVERRLVDGHQRDTVVVDQVPSQANRVEEALLAARDAGRVDLPLFELTMKEEGVRLTSLDFPHRYADAYLRDSEVDGVRFDDSQVGRTLRRVSADDVRPLYRREPYSLVFGAWDSHRQGRWPTFPRIYTSSMYGIEYLEGDRRAGRHDPLNLTGAIDDKGKAEGDWRFLAEGTRAKGRRLSEIGHGHIAPHPPRAGATTPAVRHAGVVVEEVRRTGWISLAGLERLRFGDAPAEAATAARATLAALALMGDRLAFGRPSLWLRSGCDLTRISESVYFERDGGVPEPVNVSVIEAVDAFVALRDRARAGGVIMDTDAVPVAPTRQLAEAIRAALTSTSGDGASGR
ncbi:type I-U CRISPR-associated protein Cas7 [Micromonospora fluostatini]|uniref:Type I-U CRISPR-associated protein Cas7 n=1 Tax=Micromonospora fluostatini TaxID=1629071 RepID=A0ABY2DKV6_9ACTN|nr:type I-U CRISPR-associated protein Cas7 [Micromonospora fluostatini]